MCDQPLPRVGREMHLVMRSTSWLAHLVRDQVPGRLILSHQQGPVLHIQLVQLTPGLSLLCICARVTVPASARAFKEKNSPKDHITYVAAS